MAAAAAGGVDTCFASLALDEAEHAAAPKKLELMQNGEDRTRQCSPPLHSTDIDSGSPDDDGDGNWAGLEPLLFDEAAALADHERQMRRQMQREQEEAHIQSLHDKRRKTLERILDYDPKTGTTYYAQLFIDGLYDLDEESPLGPMRETETLLDVHGTVCREVRKQFLPVGDSANILGSSDAGGERFIPCDSANIFSVKIASSDVGFPIDVYGTIVARDSIDLKCVYLFRRDRDNCQLILSKDESLVLTGPKRGLALHHFIYFEVDLKIKGARRSKDKQLSRGCVRLDGVQLRFKDKMVVQRYSVDTKLSEVVITYVAVQRAVEATFAIEVVRGKFYGEISACTTSIRHGIVLYDSKLSDGNGRGVIQLLRHVVAVGLKEKLKMTVAAWTGDGKTKSTTIIKFTPGVSGGDEKEVSYGSFKMRVKVTWSIISREYIDY